MSSSTKTVLVVDDALTIRHYHRSLLEAIDCDVIEAENGMEAMEKFLETEFDLCLVDVNMPVLDGFSFVAEVRNGTHNADCPLVMVTTEYRDLESSKGYLAGANLYLLKPTDPQFLQQVSALMLGNVPQTNAVVTPLNKSAAQTVSS